MVGIGMRVAAADLPAKSTSRFLLRFLPTKSTLLLSEREIEYLDIVIHIIFTHPCSCTSSCQKDGHTKVDTTHN